MAAPSLFADGQGLETLREDTLVQVARLARLVLSPEEHALYLADLQRFLIHVEHLNELDLSGVAPTFHPLALTPRLRPDEPAPPLNQEQALANAPHHDGQTFIVPKVL